MVGNGYVVSQSGSDYNVLVTAEGIANYSTVTVYLNANHDLNATGLLLQFDFSVCIDVWCVARSFLEKQPFFHMPMGNLGRCSSRNYLV